MICSETLLGDQECTYIDKNGTRDTFTERKDLNGVSTWLNNKGDQVICNKNYLGQIECNSKVGPTPLGSKPIDLLSVPQSLIDTVKDKKRQQQNPSKSRLDALRETEAYRRAYSQQVLQHQKEMDKLHEYYMDNCYFLEKKTEPCVRLLTLITGENTRKTRELNIESTPQDRILESSSIEITRSGLRYEVIREGTGPKPKWDDTVSVHYVGTLTNGVEFDSSIRRGIPAEFPLPNVIQGWQEGLQLMNTGGVYKFVIPSDLAYGDRGAGTVIPPGATLIFEIELINIK